MDKSGYYQGSWNYVCLCDMGKWQSRLSLPLDLEEKDSESWLNMSGFSSRSSLTLSQKQFSAISWGTICKHRKTSSNTSRNRASKHHCTLKHTHMYTEKHAFLIHTSLKSLITHGLSEISLILLIWCSRQLISMLKTVVLLKKCDTFYPGLFDE